MRFLAALAFGVDALHEDDSATAADLRRRLDATDEAPSPTAEGTLPPGTTPDDRPDDFKRIPAPGEDNPPPRGAALVKPLEYLQKGHFGVGCELLGYESSRVLFGN